MHAILTFILAHWRKVLAAALIAAAFFAGRFSNPATETVKVEERIVYQDREVTKEVIVEKKVLVKGETKVVVRDRYVYPDGSVHEQSNITILTFDDEGNLIREEDIYNPQKFADMTREWCRVADAHGTLSDAGQRLFKALGG
mgnify:CR=1 FL=1